MKKNFLFILLILASNILLHSIIEETESLRNFLFGTAPDCEYDNWTSHVVEGIASPGYNTYSAYDRQLSGFGNFTIPTELDLVHWQNIVNLFLMGNLNAAQDTIDAAGYPYQVVIFNDTDTNATYHMMREIPNYDHYDDNGTDDNYDDENGAFDFGWGLYIYNINGTVPHITTVVHPNDDYIAIPLAHKAFIDQNSKFLLISGVGREVIWTNSGNYSNSKSTCDPSRIEDHPFNVVYQAFCDEIRAEFQQPEFSLQIHSFDWGESHEGYPDVQVSAGYNQYSPDLPIRDLSSAKLDVPNFSGEFVLPANQVGIHDAVHLNDYYGFHSSRYDFNFSNSDTTFAVNTRTDLWGYSQNRQIVYTINGMNPYDNFERFLHVEMDELPNIYPQTVQDFYWFHGWDPATLTWNLEHRFDHVMEYYSPFIDALTMALQPLYQMNDNSIPEPPTDLQVVTESSLYFKLSWQPGDAYDMDSYEILYSTEPISNGTFSILDRTNTATLACLAQNEFYFTLTQPGDQYYFAVRIKDKNGNISDLSNEVLATAGPVFVSDFTAYGRDEKILLDWRATSDMAFSGFNIYRKTETSNFDQIASWLTNPNLLAQIGNNVEYNFLDENIINAAIYTYQIRAELNGQEYIYGEMRSAEARKIYELYASINSISRSDTCYFGYNKFASNGFDEHFDSPADTAAVGDYFNTEFYEQYWNDVPQNLEQEIYSYYDSETNLKTWIYRLRTNILNEPVEIGLANPARDAQRIYLYHGGNYIDLSSNTFTLTPTSTDYYSFTLFLGNLQPTLEFADLPNHIYFPGETMLISWNVNLLTTISYISVYAENEESLIPIAENLIPYQTETDWQIPNMIFENAKIRIDLIMDEGDTLSYFSPYSFGVISPQTTVQTIEGWNLKTHNFSSNLPLEDIYGINSEFYELQQEFVAVDELQFCYPYWIYTPQSNYAALNSVTLQQTAFSFPLAAGWNIIPNPHRIDYDIRQLVISLNNVDFEYYQAIQNTLIEPFFFYYDSGFEEVTELQKDKAYYLYCYEDDLELKFIPFYENIYSPEFEPDKKITITAEQNGHSAQVIVGESAVADSLFDANFDILKPELLPFDDHINFYLPMDIGYPNPVKLHQSISNWNAASEEILFEYPFELELLSTEMVHFNSELMNIPNNIYAFLQMPAELIALDGSVDYFPADSLISGSILISNEPLLDADDEMISTKFAVNNFPNPFNPETNISFNLPSESKAVLNIYNIKGQKVKQLINDRFTAGKHAVVWNGKDDNNKSVSSGIYFVRLKAGNVEASCKMLLLK